MYGRYVLQCWSQLMQCLVERQNRPLRLPKLVCMLSELPTQRNNCDSSLINARFDIVSIALFQASLHFSGARLICSLVQVAKKMIVSRVNISLP